MSAIYEEVTSSAHKKTRTFRWSPTMIEDLLSYKLGMDYQGKDFDGDKVQQYAALRE